MTYLTDPFLLYILYTTVLALLAAICFAAIFVAFRTK
jgi:hypothetical protein